MNKPRILTASVAAFLVLPNLLFAVERNWTGAGGTNDWNDQFNWDTGVPTTDTSDNIYVRLAGTITAPAINAGVLRIAVGSPDVPASGFTFGTGTFNFSEIQVADAHNGLNPTSNLYGRAFINAGTTITTGQFFVGEWDGGTGPKRWRRYDQQSIPRRALAAGATARRRLDQHLHDEWRYNYANWRSR